MRCCKTAPANIRILTNGNRDAARPYITELREYGHSIEVVQCPGVSVPPVTSPDLLIIFRCCTSAELPRKVRSAIGPTGTRVPVVLVCSEVDSDVFAELFALGLDERLPLSVSPEDLGFAVCALLRRTRISSQSPEAPCIIVPLEGGRMKRLLTHEITHVTAEGNYVKIHTCYRSFLMRITLATFAERLPEDEFLRVSRSCIVNRRAVDGSRWKDRHTWVLVLGDRESSEIRVSRERAALVREWLKQASQVNATC